MERDSGLDGLRALAALVVLAFHSHLPGFGGGFIGVDVFFVLSGFLITRKLRSNLDRDGYIGLGRFWWERVARLYPSLLLMLLIFVAVAPWLYPKANLAYEFWISGLYLSDYSKGLFNVPDYTHHTWSLAVEMKFYLLWPFVVLALHHSPRRALAVLFALFVAASLWRSGTFISEGLRRSYYPLDTRMSGLILGSTLAFVKWRPSSGLAAGLALGALILLGICSVAFSFGREVANTWGNVIVDLAALVLVASLTVRQSVTTWVFSWAPLVKLGAWSYAIYLWHYPIARLTRVAFDGPTSFLVTLIASLLLAGMSYEFFERPANLGLRALRAEARRAT